MFKFIHAADIHLDSPLLGLDKYEGAPVEEIRGATRKAFDELVRLAKTERVNFVVIAGDLYDRDLGDLNTKLFFVNKMKELQEQEIDVVLISGNHDAESLMTTRLTPPNNVHTLPTDRPDTHRIDHLRVALHGQGYAKREQSSNLVVTYPARVPEYFNIGVLHTSLDGRWKDDDGSYAPCKLSDLCARGYDYWALGHKHERECANGEAHPRIEYPGNIQGRKISEAGARGCLVVTVDSQRRAMVKFHALDVIRWEEIIVDASTAENVAEARDSAIDAVALAREGTGGRPMAARVVLTCAPRVYRQIAQSPEQFRMDLVGDVSQDVWIEKVKLHQARADGPSQSMLGADAMSELQATLAELRSDSRSDSTVLTDGDCGKLKRILPRELSEEVFEKQFKDIWDRASALLSVSAMEENP